MSWFAWLAWWRPPCLLRVVIVTLHDPTDKVVRGVLWRSRGAWLVIRSPQLVRDGLEHDPVPLEGDLVIHRSNVAYVQVEP